MTDYDAGENPMVLPVYEEEYDEEFEKERWAYLEDISWEDKKDEELGL